MWREERRKTKTHNTNENQEVLRGSPQKQNQKGKRHKQINKSKSNDTKRTNRTGIRADIRVSRKEDTKVEKARKSRERSNI